MSLKFFYEKFTKFESEYDVFQLDFQGIYFWKLIRFSIIRHLNIEKDNYLASKKNEFYNKVILSLNALKTIKYYKKNYKSSSTIGILTSSASYKTEDGNFHDRFFDKLILDNEDAVVIKRFDNQGNLDPIFSYTNNVHYHYPPFYFFADFLLSRLLRVKIKRSIQLQNLEKAFINSIGIKIPLSDIIIRHIISYNINRKRAIAYLKHNNFKEIHLTCSYGLEGFISAAKEMSIKVIEHQHGLIDEYHPGYSFPREAYVEYFPDEIILFGEYWSQFFKHINKPRISIKSNYFIRMKIDYVRKMRLGPFNYDFVFIFGHNPPIENLIKLVINNPHFNFLLKLHPLTNSNHIKRLQEFRTTFNNLSFQGDTENVYDSFLQAKSIITISSTALFEALSCGVPVMVLKMGDFDRNLSIIKRYDVELIDPGCDVIKLPPLSHKEFIDDFFL
jgi:hypothetical protein